MAGLLIEDVTLVRSPEQVTAHIRFKGGAIHVAVQRWKTDPREVAMAQQLLEDHHDHDSIAQAAGGKNYTATNVLRLLHGHPRSSGARSGKPVHPTADLRA